MNLLLNCDSIEKEINSLMHTIKTFSVSESNRAEIEQIVRCVSQIHSYNLAQSSLSLYDYQWVINLVNTRPKDMHSYDLIFAIKTMRNLERYRNSESIRFSGQKFMVWDVINSDWQKEYKEGKIGNYIWDIAAIINHVKNASFSDIFLETYLQDKEIKPTLSSIYSNLYYIQVAEAILNNQLEIVLPATRGILEENIFRTDLISAETLERFDVLGYQRQEQAVG